MLTAIIPVICKLTYSSDGMRYETKRHKLLVKLHPHSQPPVIQCGHCSINTRLVQQPEICQHSFTPVVIERLPGSVGWQNNRQFA